MDDSNIKKLGENSAQLQKLTISLVESNLKLMKKIDNLVGLFEEAAKNVSVGGHEEIIELNNKVNSLIQENKQLARGLILMENKIKGGQDRRIEGRPIPKL